VGYRALAGEVREGSVLPSIEKLFFKRLVIEFLFNCYGSYLKVGCDNLNQLNILKVHYNFGLKL
jgi:hypothetical protein